MKKKFGILLSLLTIPSAAISSCFISSCGTDKLKWFISVDASGYDSQTNTIKLKNNYYNPLNLNEEQSSINLKLEATSGISILEPNFKNCSLDLSNSPDFFKENIFIKKINGPQVEIGYSTKLAILEWDEFPIILNFNYNCNGQISSEQHFILNVAAQNEGWIDKYTLGPLTGAGDQNYSTYALTGFHDTADNCRGILMHNVQTLEIINDSRVRYLYDNFMNFLEDKQIEAPQMAGGVFGNLHRSYGDPETDYKIKTEDDQKLWDWNFGTADSPASGRWNSLIIDDYENNPNWKEDGYKTLQIGNPYTWRSWNKMFYKCYSLLPSLHHYFDGFTNEVPVAKDGSSTGEPGTPTETYQFTPEDVDAMVYGY